MRPVALPSLCMFLRIVAFLTEAADIDEILRHLEDAPPEDLFHASDPPAA